MGLAKYHMPHTLKASEEHTLSLKQEDIPVQCVKFGTGCEDSHYFLVRKSSRPKANSYAAERGLKDYTHESAFPSRYISLREHSGSVKRAPSLLA